MCSARYIEYIRRWETRTKSFNNPNPYILSLAGKRGRIRLDFNKLRRASAKAQEQKRAAEIDQKMDRHASAYYSDDDDENYYDSLQHVQEAASAHSSDDGYSRYERHAIPDPTSEAGKVAEQRAHDRGTCSLNEPPFGRYHYTSEAGSAHSLDESRFKFERFPHMGSVPERLLLVNSDQRPVHLPRSSCEKFCDDICQCENDCDAYQCASGACHKRGTVPRPVHLPRSSCEKFCDDRCQCENDCDLYQCASGACKCSALAPHCD